jgi:hypothetical protein
LGHKREPCLLFAACFNTRLAPAEEGRKLLLGPGSGVGPLGGRLRAVQRPHDRQEDQRLTRFYVGLQAKVSGPP